jgi:hypothetical protein
VLVWVLKISHSLVECVVWVLKISQNLVVYVGMGIEDKSELG